MSRLEATVVIPCRDYAAYLGEAIESALGQTRPPARVIVVDDGSTDGSREVARGHDVELLELGGVGPAAARNAGAARVETELVVFLDADDALEPEFLAACAPPLEADPALGFVYTQVRFVGGARDGQVSEHPPYDLERLKRDNTIHASALLRTAHVRELPYDPSLRDGFEDWDLYLGLAARGVFGRLVDRPLLRYRQHPASRSSALNASRARRYACELAVVEKHAGLFAPAEHRARVKKLRRRRLVAWARERVGL